LVRFRDEAVDEGRGRGLLVRFRDEAVDEGRGRGLLVRFRDEDYRACDNYTLTTTIGLRQLPDIRFEF